MIERTCCQRRIKIVIRPEPLGALTIKRPRTGWFSASDRELVIIECDRQDEANAIDVELDIIELTEYGFIEASYRADGVEVLELTAVGRMLSAAMNQRFRPREETAHATQD